MTRRPHLPHVKPSNKQHASRPTALSSLSMAVFGATLGMTLAACTPNQKNTATSPPSQNPTTQPTLNHHSEHPQNPPEKDAPTVLAGDWRLAAQTTTGTATLFDGVPWARLTLRPSTNTHLSDVDGDFYLGAWADCNGLSGSLHFNDGQLRKNSHFIATEKGCSPTAGAMDKIYFNFLDELAGYRLLKEQLVLMDKHGNELHFVPMTGIFRTWVLLQMDGLTPQKNPNHAMRLYIEKDGSATLDSHCNFLAFQIQSDTLNHNQTDALYASSGALSFQKNFNTPRDCEHGQAERSLVDFLGTVTHFSLTKTAKTEILTLHSDTATAQFTLTP
ncbi:MAG: META domain-containing protein [Moraxella sp.]|nr:META domain-containing protein [Moraxella sp.]